jgi:hypothetical protein
MPSGPSLARIDYLTGCHRITLAGKVAHKGKLGQIKAQGVIPGLAGCVHEDARRLAKEVLVCVGVECTFHPDSLPAQPITMVGKTG